MKSLKAKNVLLSLLTMLAITISLTSCKQESVVIHDAEVMYDYTGTSDIR